MKQDISRNLSGISASAFAAGKGLDEFEEVLDIKYCTSAVLAAARAMAFTAALLFNNARLLLRTKREAFNEARDAARVFATLFREILKPVFGSEFNDRWLVVGFVDSLAMPAKFEDMLELLQKMAAFLTANPTREVAALNITGAQALLLYTTFSEASAAVTLQESVVGILMDDRDAKYSALRGRVVQLVDELSYVLSPLDQRWKAFGFNKPGALETPEVPEDISVVLIGTNAAAVKWGASPRAEYYRIWMKVHGAAGDAVAVGSPADLDFTLENLPPATTVDISVSAVNNGGESQLSEPISVTTH
jgi:hypothetical protein